MSNNVSLLADLRSGKNCSIEAAIAITQLESEVERLNALVAMQAEALRFNLNTAITQDADAYDDAMSALSASSETVAAWTKERDAKLEVSDEMVDRFLSFASKSSFLNHPEVPFHGTKNGDTEEKWIRRYTKACLRASIKGE